MAQLWRISLTRREHATVLAALRYWQREGLLSSGMEHTIATDGDQLQPMTADAIDDLCLRINTSRTAPVRDPKLERLTSAHDLDLLRQSEPYANKGTIRPPRNRGDK